MCSGDHAMAAFRIAALVVLSSVLSACASMNATTCANGEHLAIQDTLYFGTGKPNGVVTPQEWAQFLETTVSPRFPDGLTVTEGAGQWRGADGLIVRETTYVLYLVHLHDKASETLVTEVVSAYKSQFRQEPVLRVKSAACVAL